MGIELKIIERLLKIIEFFRDNSLCSYIAENLKCTTYLMVKIK